jgi:hypothetical protein
MREAGGEAAEPIDVRPTSDLAWDPALEPIGNDSYEKEPFAAWWARNGARLAHLHPLVAEQWVYRHWRHSPYCYLPLDQLAWRLERWTTRNILDRVNWGDADADADPEFNYGVLRGKGGEPAHSMDRCGTWNVPPVLLHAPAGLITYDGLLADARYWLIEGHQRRRYLHALAHRGEAAGLPDAEHKVFVLFLRAQ